MNITEGLNFFAEETIKVGKGEAGKSSFNQAYDKFQAKKEKIMTRQLLEMMQHKVNVRIN